MCNKKLIVFCSNLFWVVSLYAQKQPNIIIIYTDDMGIGDLSSYNSGWVTTPNIDKLAEKGLKFNHYYTASPVSSPSRVGLITGMFPIEWKINNFLNDRRSNSNCEQRDFLDCNAPTIAKSLKLAGYKTAHIGKWHMGGGRDVDNAPQITKYGFDTYVTTYEGPDPDPLLTATNWIWSEKDSIQRWDRTSYFVDKTLSFLSHNKNTPCFVNFCPDDMHDPWIPSYGYYDQPSSWVSRENFIAVLKQYDKQIGRLLAGIEKLGIQNNTLVIFTSDNGALPTFDNARTNGLRGSKLSLYEGGVNMPFLVYWPGRVKPGEINDETIICSVDLYPSLCTIAGAELIEGFEYSGEDMSSVLLGDDLKQRTKDIMWDFGRNKYFNKPAQINQRSPHLGIRRGDWKLLVDSDGSHKELYNMKKDPHETKNVVDKYPQLASELSEVVINWYISKQ